jgi:photosystem II stability/assembly factor-like uncharacterized protein
MASKGFLAGQASVWVQPFGPNTQPQYLGCHEIGDVSAPEGDITLLYCPDPAKTGGWKQAGSYQGIGAAPTASISTHVARTADWLEMVTCPMNVFVNKVECGRRDLFSNYARSFIFRNATITTRGLTGLAARTPDAEGESMQTYDFSMEELVRIFGLQAGRQTIAATGDIDDIAFCNDAICAGPCGPAMAACQFGVAVGMSAYPLPAMIYITLDGGMNWTPAATDPFPNDDDVKAVVCFAVSPTVTRILVSRSTAQPGQHAQIAYSDDYGATWTVVDVGNVHSQYIDAHALFAIDQYHVWVGCDDGYIYFSADGGATWTIQEAGTLAPGGLSVVDFLDENLGYAGGSTNVLLKTADGGVTWEQLTMPAGQAADGIGAVDVVDIYRVWVGYGDGTLWFTNDGGLTWTQRNAPLLLGWTAVLDIQFANPLVGYLVGETGKMLRTIDGGFTWEDVPVPTTSQLLAVWVCDSNNAFAAGAVDTGLGIVNKIFPES